MERYRARQDRCCLPRKTQKIDKQNTKNKPPKLRKSAAYLLNKWLYKAEFQRCYTYSLKNSRQNSRIVEKHFLFCEHCTNSAIFQKMQNMNDNVALSLIIEALAMLCI